MSELWTYASVYFLVIASVLGTGILALPVTTSLSVGLIFQSSILVFLVELLERNSALVAMTIEHIDKNVQEVENEEDSLIQRKDEDSVHGTDLHNLGKVFLGKAASYLFTFCVLINLVSIITSYGIAGGESYGQLFMLDKKYFVAPFIILFTLILLYLSPILKGIISFFTFAKAILLVLMVVVTSIFAFHFPQTITDDWRFITKPFLMGTVALGGALNVVPLVYTKVKNSKRSMMFYSLAVVLGLTTVWILSVVWAYFILLSVPQTDGEYNLRNAYLNGDIATIPLVDIMRESDPTYSWISYVVSVFIVISVSVSFLTMGTSLKHILDGFGDSTIKNLTYRNNESGFSKVILKLNSWCGRLICAQTKYCAETGTFNFLNFMLYSLFFSIILIVALLNPSGFHLILERVTSLVLNIASLLIVLMLFSAKFNPQTAQIPGVDKSKLVSIAPSALEEKVPFSIPKAVFVPLGFCCTIYFSFACVYDITAWVLEELP